MNLFVKQAAPQLESDPNLERAIVQGPTLVVSPVGSTNLDLWVITSRLDLTQIDQPNANSIQFFFFPEK